MSLFGKNRGSGPGERVPEGTHLEVLLRLEGLVRDTSPSYAAGVAKSLATGCTETASVLDRICQRENSGPKPGPASRNLPPSP